MRRRPAFTTIELLVAISILVILAGMVFVGFKTIGGGGKTRSTKAALESARAMTAEVDASGGLASLKTIYQAPPLPITPAYLYAFPPLPSPPGANTPTPIPAPMGNISEESYSGTSTNRYTADAVVRTQLIMKRLLAAPTNRTILSQLPGERLFRWQGGTSTPPTGGMTFDANSKQPNPAMLVDAWGNPLIFVPPAGLGPITVGGNANQIQTSVGVQPAAGYTVFAPGASWFWASAGPDGDFSTGDDNVYSFE